MFKIIFLIALFFLCFFFIKENNSARARAIFILTFLSTLILNITVFFSDELKKIILNLFDINEFELLISLALLFVSFYTLYIYLEIKKIKDKLTLLIRALAIKKFDEKSNKKRLKNKKII